MSKGIKGLYGRDSLTELQLSEYIKQHSESMTMPEMARSLGCSSNVLYRVRRAYKIKQKKGSRGRPAMECESEFLWEGFSSRLLSVPFIEFRKELESIIHH